MFLSNKILLFLIVILINKFTNGDSVSKLHKSDRKSKKICEKYLNEKQFVVINDGSSCATKYPHNCVLRYSESQMRCGGSLISDQWVLTAAHCRLKMATEVILGTNDLSDDDGKIIEIEETFVHPNFNKSSKQNDIALIKLKESVKFSSTIYPACLFVNNNEPVEGTELTVTGFGKTHVLKPSSNVLVEKKHKVSSANLCFEEYKKRGYEIISSQMCANGIEIGACFGDGGGPLQLLLNEEKQISSVVGIVSYAIGHCGTEIGIFTRVSSYLDWIEEHVWPKDL